MFKRLFKKFLLVFALLLALLALFGSGSVALMKSAPEFYRPLALTRQQQEVAARSAEDKIVIVQNRAAEARRDEIIRMQAGATMPSHNAIAVSFTDDELNSMFMKWSEVGGWKNRYGRYMTDPVMILKDGRLIFAATANVGKLDAVLSMHFHPKILEDGRLNVELESVRAGKLPLPQDALIDPFRKNVENQLMARYRIWQNLSRIEPNGATNEDAVKVVLTRLVLSALNRQPCEPVLFLPVAGSQGQVPVKLTEVQIQGSTLSLTVIPLTSDERVNLMRYIREPFRIEIEQ